MAVVVNEEWRCWERIKELRARGKPLITRQGNFGFRKRKWSFWAASGKVVHLTMWSIHFEDGKTLRSVDISEADCPQTWSVIPEKRVLRHTAMYTQMLVCTYYAIRFPTSPNSLAAIWQTEFYTLGFALRRNMFLRAIKISCKLWICSNYIMICLVLVTVDVSMHSLPLVNTFTLTHAHTHTHNNK